MMWARRGRWRLWCRDRCSTWRLRGEGGLAGLVDGHGAGRSCSPWAARRFRDWRDRRLGPGSPGAGRRRSPGCWRGDAAPQAKCEGHECEDRPRGPHSSCLSLTCACRRHGSPIEAIPVGRAVMWARVSSCPQPGVGTTFRLFVSWRWQRTTGVRSRRRKKGPAGRNERRSPFCRALSLCPVVCPVRGSAVAPAVKARKAGSAGGLRMLVLGADAGLEPNLWRAKVRTLWLP